MARDELSDLRTFVLVAREESFTRAAAKLGVSPSAVSHTIRALEGRLGLRLLTRTTRSVAMTEAGERLYSSVSEHLAQIQAEIDALSELRDKPAGTIRINSSVHAMEMTVRPRLAAFLAAYPDIKLDLRVNERFLVDHRTTRRVDQIRSRFH